MSTAWNVDARGHEHVSFQMDQSKVTPRTHVRSLVEAGADLGENRTKFDRRACSTPRQGAREKCPPQVLAGHARNE
jgi:hypothetical protein